MTSKELRPLYRSILLMSGPAFAELFLSSLYGVVNMVMVGRLDTGTPGNISAVGITTQPFFLLISFFAAVNIGTTTLVAWRIGAGEKHEVPAILRQSLILNLALSIVLGFAGILTAPYVMGFMSRDVAIAAKAAVYFRIVCASLPFMAVNQAITAALRGAGQTKIPMYYNLVANALNVLFGYILIFGRFGAPQLGVTGAALAAALARAVSAIIPLCYILFNKNSVIRIKTLALLKDAVKPRLDIIKLLLSIGFPSSLEQIVLQGGLLLFHRVVNTLGAATYDAHQIAISVNGMAFSVSQAFSVSATTLAGQAVGIGDYALAEQRTRHTARVARISAFSVAILIFIFAEPLIRLYTDVDEVVSIALPVFAFIAIIQFIQSAQMCRAGALRGAGDTLYPFYSSLAGIWLFRLPLAYLFIWLFGQDGPWGLNLGLAGAWLSFFFDQNLRNIIIKRRFDKGKWKEIKDKKDRKKALLNKS
ncbi:MAG: MATE family efflux transporter [Defluviitaleaceae bacterium]|nr:MATE family efflux transporter [Defluviitaleaceae bacterium]